MEEQLEVYVAILFVSITDKAIAGASMPCKCNKYCPYQAEVVFLPRVNNDRSVQNASFFLKTMSYKGISLNNADKFKPHLVGLLHVIPSVKKEVRSYDRLHLADTC